MCILCIVLFEAINHIWVARSALQKISDVPFKVPPTHLFKHLQNVEKLRK